MVNFISKEAYGFQDLLEIMRILRKKENCPWTSAQTHESIRRDFIEEVYEVSEAIDLKDSGLLCEELGDALMIIVFHALIAEENGDFNLDDICDGICKKLILRQPHVFSDVVAKTASEVADNWEEIKRTEKGQKTYSDALNQVAKSLPALIYAEKVQKKARVAGFDWPDVTGAMEKIDEEKAELISAMNGDGDPEEELGDLLFAVVNTARFLNIDPERALEKASRKFVNRFNKMESLAGEGLDKMSLAEMDKLWDKAKKI